MECPRCGSSDVRKIGHCISLTGLKQRYQCKKGHTFMRKSDYTGKTSRRRN